MRRCLAVVLLAVPLTLGAADFYLVRHAEKQPGDDPDPGLTATGLERSRNLAIWLGAVGIQRIYSSNFRRTRLTAAPLALALGLDLDLYDPGDLEGLAERIRQGDETVLVVGHSDTTPALARALGGDPGPPLPESEYGRIYLIDMNGDAVRTRLFQQPPRSPATP